MILSVICYTESLEDGKEPDDIHMAEEDISEYGSDFSGTQYIILTLVIVPLTNYVSLISRLTLREPVYDSVHMHQPLQTKNIFSLEKDTVLGW